MKTLAFLLLPALFALSSCGSGTRGDVGKNAEARDYPVAPADFTRVRLTDGFWKTWVETAKTTTIPYSFDKCEETSRIDNFRFAAGVEEGRFRGSYGFDDSDVYKIMEGAAYSLMLDHDPAMETYLDTLVSYLAGAQEEDGYLYTAWTLKANEYNDFACCTYSPEGQWVGTTQGSHEFYNAGHMYEAAVAHFLATGKRDFLEVALKHADRVYEVCLVENRPLAPQHQEIEIGLVKLYRASGDPRYLELARHLLDIRHEVMDDPYMQAHLPVTDQREAVGHAVRANYMYSAMADIAALTGDTAYLEAVTALWNNVAGKKLSITGGVGASHAGEAYGANYELPNDPYNETCAAIANVYWNHRMFLLSGDARYMDVLERTLYNGVLPGLALDGTHFFYPNTLRHDGQGDFNQGTSGRSPWFGCSCCPSNLSRFIPSVAGYAYAVQGKNVYVNLFMNGEADLATDGGTFRLRQESNYPWDGEILLEYTGDRAMEANLNIRIPGWTADRVVPSDLFRFLDPARGRPSLRLNGEMLAQEMASGYVSLKRTWEPGDQVVLHLPLEVRRVAAHDSVAAKEGLVALQCGPLVYCAEETDNRQDVLTAAISEGDVFRTRFDPGRLGGVLVLESENLELVPYYAWANRGPGKMNVWFRNGDGS